MLKLTNTKMNYYGLPIMIAAAHIVFVAAKDDETEIQTVNGNYTVKESLDHVEKELARWLRAPGAI